MTRLTNFPRVRIPGWLVALSGCSIAVLGAMGWITHRALTLEIAEANARAAATRQEAVRLALWRMDSWMTSLIAREAARPYFHYLSFYPADRPYAFYSSEMSIESLGAADKVSPSPLLTSPPQDVKLYFQIWPDGHVTSPQVPTGGLRGLALLADASGSTIDAASGTLDELTKLLANGESRRALGAGEQLPSREFAGSESAMQSDAQRSFGTLDAGGVVSADQAKSEGGPGGPAANRVANQSDPRALQQMEPDGKQSWQTSNDYQVRQQVAETTRNLSQNRAPTYQTTSTGTAAPATSVQSASANEPASSKDSKAVADAALRKSTEKTPDAAGDHQPQKSGIAERNEAVAKTPVLAESQPKELADKEAIAGEGASKAPPGAPAGRDSGKDVATQDSKHDRKNDRREDQVQLSSAGAPAANTKVADHTSAAPPVTGSATGSDSGSLTGAASGAGGPDPKGLKVKEASVSRPTGDAAIPTGSPSSPGGQKPPDTTPETRDDNKLDTAVKDSARRYDRDSFPVVVRSLAIEPTPLITACVASPQEFFTKPAAPTFALPNAPVSSSPRWDAGTHSPTLTPPRDAGTPIVHTSVPFNLFLTRQVPLDSGRVVQGMWLDWPMLRANLLALSQDLLPGATLELCAPMSPSIATADSGLMLASIPARLVLPPAPPLQISMLSLLTGDTWSPTRIAIVGGWIAVLAGIVAIGWVLRQSVQLGERRGRFVSAVTHELRTPLTTFALYSQMLADGMVQDPEAQREYHQTLRKESDRLSRIVESVLDYARLGKRRGDSNGQVMRPAINAADLLSAVVPHLRSRASVSGLELVIEAPDLSAVTLRAERDSIERILENLVENAGKYAAGHGTDQRLHLIGALDGRWLHLDIADHGPGIASGEARRVFAPFERGKAQQDGSKPGLGLGLAFARGLARDLGGDLTLLSPQPGFGAIFRLRIPAEITPRDSATSPDSPGAEGLIEGRTGGQNPESATGGASIPENRPR